MAMMNYIINGKYLWAPEHIQSNTQICRREPEIICNLMKTEVHFFHEPYHLIYKNTL